MIQLVSRNLILLLNGLIAYGCVADNTQPIAGVEFESQISVQKREREVVDHNIWILSDMTNRIDRMSNRSLHDSSLINRFIDVFQNDLVSSDNRMKARMDRITWSTIALGNADAGLVEIDLGEKFLSGKKYDQLGSINYLKFNVQNEIAPNLKYDLKGMKEEVRKAYTYPRDVSGDIYSFLSLKYRVPRMKIPPTTFRNIRTSHRYNNVIVILTDGYLEYGRNGSQSWYRNSSALKEFRRKVMATSYVTSEDWDDIPDLPGIEPFFNDQFKGCRVLCVCFEDATRASSGSRREKVGDVAINRYVWKKWLLSSGAEKVEIHEMPFNLNDAGRIFKDFVLQD